jgi:hypothetical protein
LVISHDSANPGISNPVEASVEIRGSAKGRTCWFAATVVPRHGRISSIGGGEIAEIKVVTMAEPLGGGVSVSAGMAVGVSPLDPPDVGVFVGAFVAGIAVDVLELPQATATTATKAISA